MKNTSKSPGLVGATGDRPVRFLALGDSGTGSAAQYQVAAAAHTVSRVYGADFVLGLGDNIYEYGVRSAYDLQFETKFEQPYRELQMPFYFVLGNHDNSSDRMEGDGCQNSNGNFEVAYHYRSDRLSNKWQLPARYYTFRYGPVQFFVLDTNPLMGLDPEWPAHYHSEQQRWLDRALAGSTARWKIVAGHHPLYSNGFHGDAGSYDQTPGLGNDVRLFLQQSVLGKADLYLAGHDHNLMWITPQIDHNNTQLVICGAAGRTGPLVNPGANPTLFETADTLGFAWFEIAGDRLHALFFDGDGKPLFDHVVLKAEQLQIELQPRREHVLTPPVGHRRG